MSCDNLLSGSEVMDNDHLGINFQVYDLEKNGGSIFGGVFKLFQNKGKNPPPPRDPKLPPKPKGQTVGSFKDGLQSLPKAIANGLGDKIRFNPQPHATFIFSVQRFKKSKKAQGQAITELSIVRDCIFISKQ